MPEPMRQMATEQSTLKSAAAACDPATATRQVSARSGLVSALSTRG
ncbi:MAG: hypothetical protein IPG17_00130 [Sandaracinaceae bacterium]|nr:hypothetical protein [Sandaracinaceae bacterium]